MCRSIIIVLFLLFLGVGSISAFPKGGKIMVTVNSMPPSVVKTVPVAGDTNVDPSTREIRVTFSKDMLTDRMWSWCFTSRRLFPAIDPSKIHFLKDKRTCVLPVKLKPGRTYVIWINTPQSNSFRDTGNRPAVPYLLVFQTAKSKSK